MKGSNSSQTIQAFGCAPLTNRKSFCRTFAATTGQKGEFASAPSSHDLSSAAFTINIAESNFRHTQAKIGLRDRKYLRRPNERNDTGENPPRNGLSLKSA